jgi:hypothetical protein
MEDASDDRLKILCKRVANEQDLEKLLELVHEISNLLEAKRSRQTRASGEN